MVERRAIAANLTDFSIHLFVPNALPGTAATGQQGDR